MTTEVKENLFASHHRCFFKSFQCGLRVMAAVDSIVEKYTFLLVSRFFFLSSKFQVIKKMSNIR